MALFRSDPTFYPSARLASQAPPERHAFVAALNPNGSALHDALVTVDVDPSSSTYGSVVGKVEMPNAGDELHHFVGMLAVPPSVPMHRTLTSNGVTCSSPASAPHAFT